MWLNLVLEEDTLNYLCKKFWSNYCTGNDRTPHLL